MEPHEPQKWNSLRQMQTGVGMGSVSHKISGRQCYSWHHRQADKPYLISEFTRGAKSKLCTTRGEHT